MVKAHKDVERKAMLQVQAITMWSAPSAPGQPAVGRPLLLSLTEDGLNLRSLPDAMLRFQVRGALSEAAQGEVGRTHA